MAGDAQITTKDVVLRLDEKVDSLIRDMADVKVIAGTVGTTVTQLIDHEQRLRSLETSRSEETGEKAYRRWFPAFIGSLVAGIWWLPDLLRHHH